METTTKSNFVTNVAARVAGEDIKPGDFVTALNEIYELPSYLWTGACGTLPADEPVRTLYMSSDSGFPHKVVAVCLPFVYAKSANRSVLIFDIRKHQLARLDRKTGKRVWKRLRNKIKKNKAED